MSVIITRYIPPNKASKEEWPHRHWDWEAYHDGDANQPWKHGCGRTEKEALADLARLDQERAEVEENDNA